MSSLQESKEATRATKRLKEAAVQGKEAVIMIKTWAASSLVPNHPSSRTQSQKKQVLKRARKAKTVSHIDRSLIRAWQHRLREHKELGMMMNHPRQRSKATKVSRCTTAQRRTS